MKSVLEEYFVFAKIYKQNPVRLDQFLNTGFSVWQGIHWTELKGVSCLIPLSLVDYQIYLFFPVFVMLIQLPWMNLELLVVVDFGPGMLLHG